MTQALARRIALGGALAREAFGPAGRVCHSPRLSATPSSPRTLHARLDRIERRQDAIPFLDDPDMRFRNRVLAAGADRQARSCSA